MPLTDVNIRARVETGLTKTTAKLTYKNLLSEKLVEITFEYPMVKDQVVDEFSALIGDRNVVAIIKIKEKA